MALTVVEKASRTDVGLQRQSNEDSFLERSPLFAVADGMGGARAGEVASRLAVEAFDTNAGAGGTPEEQLADVARAANRQIFEMAQRDAERAGMGTTFTAALVTGREVAVGHVGDSRLYRLRDGRLERLTDDHSLVEEFVRQGKLTPEEAEVHPQRSIITRALGPEAEVAVDTHTHAGRAGDVYLLCSDGLTGMVPEKRIAEFLGSGEPLATVADKLIQAANSAGGKDNITVVLFRLGDGGGAADESDTLAGQQTEAGGISADAVREAHGDGDGRGSRAASATRIRPAATATPAATRVGAGTAQARRPGPPRRPAAAEPPRRRRAVTASLVLLLVAALLVGVYIASRQFWFIGTNDRGQVTLYRGVPYSLPLGVALFTESYQSSVPASTIDPQRRANIVNHQLRSHGDAVDVVRQLESTQARP